MNWEAISALAGIFAAVAVVLTVVYLAIQIRENTAATRSHTHYLATAALAETAAIIASDEKLSRIYNTGLATPDELDENEYFRFALIGTSQFRSFENLFFQYRSGFVDEDFWSGHRENILWFYHRPGMQVWWEEKRLGFSVSFREFLESSKASDLKSPEGRRV
jgi:hypothetical protein